MTEELVARLRGPSTSYLVRYQLRVSISYPQLTGEAWVLPSKSGRERSLIAVAVVGSDFQEALAGGRVVPAKLSSFRVHPGRSRRRTGPIAAREPRQLRTRTSSWLSFALFSSHNSVKRWRAASKIRLRAHSASGSTEQRSPSTGPLSTPT